MVVCWTATNWVGLHLFFDRIMIPVPLLFFFLVVPLLCNFGSRSLNVRPGGEFVPPSCSSLYIV